MDEVYVLISGAYSDWNIEGFVESEEEAIKTCIAFNEGEKKRLGDNYNDYWDEIYYMKANKFNKVNPKKLKDIHPLYEYRVIAWKKDGSWDFGDEDGVDINAVEKSYPDVQFYKGGLVGNESATIHLTLNTLDRKKALKIAQDMLYQKIAEREGL